MGVLSNDNSINHAVEQLLTPQQEQGDAEVPEQENPEVETLEVDDSGQDEAEVVEEDEPSYEEEVGDSEEEDSPYEEDETPEVAKATDEFYTVKVDGEEFEVNLEELKKGYQLEKNYTKKTQALAEERNSLTELKTQLEQERDRYLQVTAQIAQQSNAQVEQAKLELSQIDKKSDPIGYVQKQLEVQEIEQNLTNQVRNYEAALTQKQVEDQKRLSHFLEEQNNILSQQLEGWNNPEENEAIKKGIMKFAEKQGYSADELANVRSAKDIMVLNKARLYDEMVAAKAVVREKRSPKKATPVIRSATKATNSTTKARAVKQKREQLHRSGSVKDAQSLMMDLMQRKPIRKK